MQVFSNKVGEISKGSLDLIPSPLPSVKFKLWAGKLAQVVKARYYWALLTNFWKKKFVDITQQCFALLPQVKFPANNLNFHWKRMWWDRNQTIFLNLFYFTIFSKKFLMNGICMIQILNLFIFEPVFFDFMKTRYFSWYQQGLAWKVLVKSTLFS